ncbi:MAG: putative rane protein [Gemmatimonadetes bacterium]|nr:putative rane protein [Gemmatimonadota bacterium]
MQNDPRPTLRRPSALKLLARGVLFRCPWCGGGGLMKSWFHLKPRCPTCGLRTERGEEDFFLGAMVVNIAIAEGLLALILVGVMYGTWPRVPWLALEIGGPVLMVAAPILFYPVSKTLWLAVELLFRPLTHEELDWHRSSDETTFRRQEDR